MRSGGNECPKPLRKVGRVPMIGRVLRTLAKAGVSETAVITGYRAQDVEAAVRAVRPRGMRIEFIRNQEYLRKNGVSVLAAADFIGTECLLSMADHLYSPLLVERLLRQPIPCDGCALAVDYNIAACLDLDDATKVRVRHGRIAEIGKTLRNFDALDTGVFRITPALVGELERVRDERGDCSLSDGVGALAAGGHFWACDVGDARWIDVDTPELRAEAERLLEVLGDDLAGARVAPQPFVHATAPA